MKWKYFVTWLPGIPIAILNGTLRTYVYLEYLDELAAHQWSVFSFILLFGIYVWLIYPWLKLESRFQSLMVGVYWVLMTVLFEFVFGHFVMGHSWNLLFHDYNLLAGRLWIMVLIWILIAPFTFFQWRYVKMNKAKS